MNFADMEAHDAWLAERPDVETNYDGEEVTLAGWVCPNCDHTVGCSTCTPPF